jgi:hypothetical protein
MYFNKVTKCKESLHYVQMRVCERGSLYMWWPPRPGVRQSARPAKAMLRVYVAPNPISRGVDRKRHPLTIQRDRRERLSYDHRCDQLGRRHHARGPATGWSAGEDLAATPRHE